MEHISGKQLPVNKRLVTAAALWLASVCLMAVSIAGDDPRLGRAAVLLAIMATMPTLWLIVEHVVVQERRKGVRGIAEAIGRGQADGHLRHLR